MFARSARNPTFVIGLLTLVAMVGLLGVPFAMRPPSAMVTDPEELIIISPHDEAVKDEFERAFSEWHKEHFGRPVRITWPSIGGGGDIRRYVESQFAAEFRRVFDGRLPPRDMPWQSIDRPGFDNHDEIVDYRKRLESVGIGIDIFFGGGDYEQNQFKSNGWSVPVGLGPDHDFTRVVPQALGGVAMFDTDAWCPGCRKWISGVVTTQPTCRDCDGPAEPADSHYWFGAVLTRVGIVYNNIVCDRLNVPAGRRPATWMDLRDRIYRGNLALADPNFSGSAKLCYEMVLQRHGWDEGWRLLTDIAANARYFGSSSTQVALDVSRCDAAAGMIIDYYGRTQVDFVGRDPCGQLRLHYVSPVGATATTADPISIIRGAPNRKVAERFVQFVLSSAGQKLWMGRVGSPGGPRRFALYRPPIRPDTYAQFGEHMIFDENPFAEDGSFNLNSRVLGRRFGLLGVLMRAAFIDNSDLLKAAADHAHSAKPGSPARQAFDTLPFPEGDPSARNLADGSMWAWVDRYNRERGEPAREKIAGELADLFREKYRAVLNAATQ